MAYPRTTEFSKHSENLAEIVKGITQIERLHKHALRTNDLSALTTVQRLHHMMIGVYAEALLRKIATDPLGFNDRERTLLWRTRTQIDRWTQAVELAFRRQYSVLVHDPLNAQSLGRENAQRFGEISEVLESRLQTVIEDRNKTAHGQWMWHLKSGKDNEFKDGSPPPLPNYTMLAAQYGSIRAIGALVHVLAISEATFQRDYDDLTQKLRGHLPGLSGAGHTEWAASLRNKKASAPRT